MGTKLQGSTTVYMPVRAARYLLDFSATYILRIDVPIQRTFNV